MSDKVDRMLARQRDRAIATILDFKERECDEYLPVEVQRKLRKVVLDQLNELTIFAVDLADGGEAIVNELFLEKLDEIKVTVLQAVGTRGA